MKKHSLLLAGEIIKRPSHIQASRPAQMPIEFGAEPTETDARFDNLVPDNMEASRQRLLALIGDAAKDAFAQATGAAEPLTPKRPTTPRR